MAVNKKLLLVNTFVSYLRTVVNIGFALFTTRWIVAELGVQDYGLYFVVGGVITFASILNTAFAAGSYRFIAHSVDRSQYEVIKWFSASVYVHAVCAIFVAIVSVPVYYIAFKWIFEIPETRIIACDVVYWCSVVITIALVLNAPFVAMFTSYQRIFEVTIIHMINTFALFVFAYCLHFFVLDKLIVYAIGYAVIQVIIYLIQIVRCMFCFETARVMRISAICVSDFRRLLAFSWWSLLDSLSYMLRGYGIQLIFNRSALIGANAAYSVANQLATQSQVLSGALTSAMAPGIISQYGSGDVDGACIWGLRTCKIATILSMLVVIPLFVACKSILDLWIIDYPIYTVGFCRVMVGMFFVTQLVTGLNTLIRATGNIRRYQILTSVSYLLGALFALLIFLLGLPVAWAIWGILVSVILYALSTVVEANRLGVVESRVWLSKVFSKGVVIAIISLSVSSLATLIEVGAFARVVIVTIVASSSTMVISWLYYLSHEEQMYILDKIKDIVW